MHFRVTQAQQGRQTLVELSERGPWREGTYKVLNNK